MALDEGGFVASRRGGFQRKDATEGPRQATGSVEPADR
jgi:hypothetical protein